MTPTPGGAALAEHEAPPKSSSSSSGRVDRAPAGNKSWATRYRAVEFSMSIAIIALASAFSRVPVHKRDIPNIEVRISATNVVYARDPTINNKMMDSQVSMLALVILSTSVPILVNLFINFVLPRFRSVRVIPHDTRDFLLSLLQSIGIARLLTHFMKNMTGRLRPCFYDMCKWNYDVVWDGKTNLCQDKKGEREARLSFPSGHASYAWSTLFLMTLYLLGRSRLNCENRGETLMRGGRKILKLFLCFLPTLVAAWVAITRSVDNWHHYTDIVTGSIIGAFAAGFGYSYNYGSIFHWESAGLPYQEFHQRRKKKNDDAQDPDTDARNVHSQSHGHNQNHSHSNASYSTALPPKTGGSDSFSINMK